MKSTVLGVVTMICMAVTPPCSADAAKALTNADVVQMVKAGLSESTILLSIKNAPAEFKTAPADLIALKKAGVSEPVMDAMLTHGASPSVAPTAPIPPVAANYSAMAGRNGLVAIDGDRQVELFIATQYATKSKRKFWSNEEIAILPGSQAKIRLTSRTPAFPIAAPPNVDPEQTVRLMKMTVRGDSREATLRINSYDTLLRRVPKVTDGVVETTLSPAPDAAANGVMTALLLTPKSPLEPGEYAVIQYDSQIWDFGVD